MPIQDRKLSDNYWYNAAVVLEFLGREAFSLLGNGLLLAALKIFGL